MVNAWQPNGQADRSTLRTINAGHASDAASSSPSAPGLPGSGPFWACRGGHLEASTHTGDHPLVPRIHLHERSLHLRRPLSTAFGRINTRRVFVLEIQDDSGAGGMGEAAPLPALGGEDPVTCREALQDVLPLLEQHLPLLLGDDAGEGLLGSLEARLAKAPCARACVEGAVLDLAANRRDLPLANLLRLDLSDPPMLPVYCLISGTDPEELGEVASYQVSKGWRTIQWEATGDPRFDLEMVRHLRTCVGRSVQLRIDVNGAWDRDGAQSFLVAARELDLEFVEQPLPAGDLEGMAILRRLRSAPIAADQAVASAGDVGRVVAAQAADLVVLKPMALGGWRPTRMAADLAASMGTEVIVNTFLDGSIGRAHASHIAAALGLSRRSLGLATGSLLAEDLTFAPLKPQAGFLPLRPGAGLGIGDLIHLVELP